MLSLRLRLLPRVTSLQNTHLWPPDASQLPSHPQAYAVAGHTLANIGVVCASCNRRWGYDQVVDLLLKLYKFPQFSISRALLHGAPAANPEAEAAAAAKRRAAAASGADPRLALRVNQASVPIGGMGGR